MKTESRAPERSDASTRSPWFAFTITQRMQTTSVGLPLVAEG